MRGDSADQTEVRARSITFQKMELLQEAGHHEGVTEVQQEPTECHARAADI